MHIYEMWREVDRQATAAEMELKWFTGSAADVTRARELRTKADSLFDAALLRMDQLVQAAIKQAELDFRRHPE